MDFGLPEKLHMRDKPCLVIGLGHDENYTNILEEYMTNACLELVSERYRYSFSGFMALLTGLKAFLFVFVGFSQERCRFLEICGQNFDVLWKSDRIGT